VVIKNLERQDINIKDNIFSLLSENDKIEREIKGLSRGRIPLDEYSVILRASKFPRNF
jgi:hypothetical protein